MADGGELKDVLNFSNWPYYMDVEEKKHPHARPVRGRDRHQGQLLRGHQPNDEFFATVQGRLSQGEGITGDLIVATDNSRFPGLYVDEGWVQPLDKGPHPELRNLIEAQASPPFDPERTYSLPWLSGMDGIAWNEDLTGPVTTVTQLDDPKLKGKVTVWNSMVDTLALVMLDNGTTRRKSPTNRDGRWSVVQAAVQDPGQIRRFTGNDYAQPLAQGDIASLRGVVG